MGVEGRYQPKKRRKRGTIDTEGGFIGSYESLRASIPAPLMYSNAKCVRPGPPLAFKRWGGTEGWRPPLIDAHPNSGTDPSHSIHMHICVHVRTFIFFFLAILSNCFLAICAGDLISISMRACFGLLLASHTLIPNLPPTTTTTRLSRARTGG